MQTIDLSYIERPNKTFLLKVTINENQNGIIFRVTSVLFAHDWDIIEAVAEIVDENIVKDVFIIKSLKDEKLDQNQILLMKHELNQLFFTDLDVKDYFEAYKKNVNDYKKEFHSTINLFNPQSVDSTVLDIRTFDRPGLLFEISYLLYKKEIDIISFTAKSEKNEIRDSFLLRNKDGEPLSEEICLDLKSNLIEIFNTSIPS